MKCKQCGHKIKVVRTEQIGENIYRVRYCFHCKNTFSTVEQLWQKETSLTPSLTVDQGGSKKTLDKKTGL